MRCLCRKVGSEAPVLAKRDEIAGLTPPLSIHLRVACKPHRLYSPSQSRLSPINTHLLRLTTTRIPHLPRFIQANRLHTPQILRSLALDRALPAGRGAQVWFLWRSCKVLPMFLATPWTFKLCVGSRLDLHQPVKHSMQAMESDFTLPSTVVVQVSKAVKKINVWIVQLLTSPRIRIPDVTHHITI